MAIAIGATTLFTGNTHGDVIEEDYQRQDRVGQFFGVQGETEIVDEPKGRNLSVRVHARDYVTVTAIHADLDTFRPNKTGQRDVDLVISGTDLDRTYNNCTYKGYDKDARGIRKNAVDNKYSLWVTLKFRQLKGF